MQTVYACGGASGGSQQREVADGADVVFTDTGRGSGCFGIKVRTDTAELSDTRTAGLRKYDEMCRSKWVIWQSIPWCYISHSLQLIFYQMLRRVPIIYEVIFMADSNSLKISAIYVCSLSVFVLHVVFILQSITQVLPVTWYLEQFTR